jgi:hypothetical protein
MNLNRASIDENLSRIRPVKSVYDIHHRGFSRPVLAYQSMHRTRCDRKGDGAIRVNGTKAFVDAAQFERG